MGEIQNLFTSEYLVLSFIRRIWSCRDPQCWSTEETHGKVLLNGEIDKPGFCHMYIKIWITFSGWSVPAHGLADGQLLHVPLLLARCRDARTGCYRSTILNWIDIKSHPTGDHPHGWRCHSAEPTSGDKVLLTAPRPHSLRGKSKPISFDYSLLIMSH